MKEELKHIHFQQRFNNFEKAFLQLKAAVDDVEHLSTLAKEGLIQRFEYTFELAWKTLKDYLESQSVDVKFPREVIKQSFQYQLLNNGDIWMDMLEKRHLLAHTYDEQNFQLALASITRSYYPQMNALYQLLQQKQ